MLDIYLWIYCDKEKSKDTEVQFKVKIRKHGKMKNDKDEIGNIDNVYVEKQG